MMKMEIAALQDIIVAKIERKVREDHGKGYIDPQALEYEINEALERIADDLVVPHYE